MLPLITSFASSCKVRHLHRLFSVSISVILLAGLLLSLTGCAGSSSTRRSKGNLSTGMKKSAKKEKMKTRGSKSSNKKEKKSGQSGSRNRSNVTMPDDDYDDEMTTADYIDCCFTGLELMGEIAEAAAESDYDAGNDVEKYDNLSSSSNQSHVDTTYYWPNEKNTLNKPLPVDTSTTGEIVRIYAWSDSLNKYIWKDSEVKGSNSQDVFSDTLGAIGPHCADSTNGLNRIQGNVVNMGPSTPSESSTFSTHNDPVTENGPSSHHIWMQPQKRHGGVGINLSSGLLSEPGEFVGTSEFSFSISEYVPKNRMRYDLHAGIEYSPVSEAGSLHQSIGGITTFSIRADLNRYLTPFHTFIGSYITFGAGYNYTSWEYKNTLVLEYEDGEIERIKNDALDGWEIYTGFGINLMQTKATNIGLDVTPGLKFWSGETEEGFNNDVFDPMFYIRIGARITFALGSR